MDDNNVSGKSLQTPFHAYYAAMRLAGLSGDEKLSALYASANIEIYPYQVAAALFALRSTYLKGCILCDDGSLGKSIEAMLVITGRWYEGRRRILIVVPTPLLHQWTKIIDERFSVPLYTIDSNIVWSEQIQSGNENPFAQDGVVITTYDFAAEKAEFISQIPWDMTVFDEAHRLRKIYTGENTKSTAIRNAVGDSYKLLLTATPMQNDIMDLYGLIYFIDETALPDSDIFYKRYFRKPENYPELADRVSRFCFRTMRPQVATYVKISERIPITIEYTLTAQEEQLAELLDKYLAIEIKNAFPKMELYDLTLMLYHRLSSSTFALERTLKGMEARLAAQSGARDELALVRSMLDICDSITENAKSEALLAALKSGFARLKQLEAKSKAIIFAEYRETQKHLFELLNRGEYEGKVLTFSGDQSRDYTVMERFENEAAILITTDIAAEGFNLEFCSFVINYDLVYNTLTLEQRISRCHRQGQRFDVFVVNFLNRNNFADVRMLELINKRVLQFDGIIGLSDDVIGHFSTGGDFKKHLAAARTKEEIDSTFDTVLEQHEGHNKALVQSAEQSLFSSFAKDITDAVTVSPQYIRQRIAELNGELWKLTKHYFHCYNREHEDSPFAIDDTAQTVTATADKLPHLFYYWTGSRNKPYTSQRKYGIDKTFKPASGRITLSSVIGRGILQETECSETGTLTVAGLIEPCVIGLYSVIVGFGVAVQEYVVLAGKTEDGRALSEDECQELMKLPAVSYTEDGRKSARWLRESTGGGAPHELDRLIQPEEYTRRYLEETDSAISEEIQRLKLAAEDRKIALDRQLDDLRMKLKAAEAGDATVTTRMEKLERSKRLAVLQKELKQAEQSLFMDTMRIDVALEAQIKELTDKAKITVKIHRQFAIQIRSVAL